jgi:glucose/arabinose dehydrogenase
MRAAFLFLASLVAVDAAPASGLQVPPAFTIETIAQIRGARELVTLPNGDLIVGTNGRDVYIVTDAEGGNATAHVFATLNDDHASGVTFSAARREIFIGTMHGVWVIPYRGEPAAAQIRQIASVRSGPLAPGTDGDVHTTTSVAFADGLLYVAAGSSCNAKMNDGRSPCVEVDPTRAAISVMKPDGSALTQRAKHIRNAIALAVNPQTHAVWVGDAGQDDLPFGHPYEFLDDLTAHPSIADYGWPWCEENHQSYVPGYNCSRTVEPLVELPAYSTIVGATFYSARQTGAYAFPQPYRGGLFVAAHGSWHTFASGCNAAPPRVVFVAMSGDRPLKGIDWSTPAAQWSDFATGFQSGCTARIGRPVGLAVGPKGSLFVSDDDAGVIYRIRPKHV